jgi:methyl-accepting chemotaxis protein
MESTGISLRTRLLLITLLTIIGLLAIFGVVLSSERGILIKDRQEKLRNLGEVAYGIVAEYQKAEQDGRMSRTDAQNAAMNAIHDLRYDKVEYFWINDLGKPYPKMIMHPTVPTLNGKLLDAEKFNKATSEQAGLDGPKTSLRLGTNYP